MGDKGTVTGPNRSPQALKKESRESELDAEKQLAKLQGGFTREKAAAVGLRVLKVAFITVLACSWASAIWGSKMESKGTKLAEPEQGVWCSCKRSRYPHTSFQ